MDNKIILYPINWLYNAGIIGFLRVVAYRLGESEVESNVIHNDGSVAIDLKWFDGSPLPTSLDWYIQFFVKNKQPDFESWSKGEKKKKGKQKGNGEEGSEKEEGLVKWLKKEKNKKEFDRIVKIFSDQDRAKKFLYFGNKHFASKTQFQNLVQLKEWREFKFVNILKELSNLTESGDNECCGLCGRYFVYDKSPNEELRKRLSTFQDSHFQALAGSIGKFPNSFWNLNASVKICYLCSYLLLHRVIPFAETRVNRGYAQLFINTPSFKIMWYLNKYLAEVVGRGHKELREILGMSLLECALKIKASLGVWSLSNIELIVEKRDTVDFYSLPTSVTGLLLNKDVASALNDIGELSILELVMREKFDELLEVSHNLIKFQMKESLSKNDWDYLNRYFYLSKNKEKSKFSSTAYKLSQLYGAVKEVIKSEV